MSLRGSHTTGPVDQFGRSSALQEPLSFIKRKVFHPQRKWPHFVRLNFRLSENSFLFGVKHFFFVKEKGLRERGRPGVQIPTGPTNPFLSLGKKEKCFIPKERGHLRRPHGVSMTYHVHLSQVKVCSLGLHDPGRSFDFRTPLERMRER